MKGKLIGPLAACALLGSQAQAIAHGARIDYQIQSAVEIQSSYDTGEPMQQAQVAVYAPDNPSEPWLTGETDDSGKFTFTPDTEITGNWEVQVRQAGHGDIVAISLGEDSQLQAAIVKGSTGYSASQLILMGLMGVWGFVGTALFFWRRKG
ncbi:carboxypeptidase regulatory-like domain-containing protein [Sphaerothrix gracilis]|uniref:carboxypeptidase regulatory-like domain-containing protein n=1 Tax=Sphaerothrix gracilis TaxID=3151835 RepID=UPI0031FCCF0A